MRRSSTSRALHHACAHSYHAFAPWCVTGSPIFREFAGRLAAKEAEVLGDDAAVDAARAHRITNGGGASAAELAAAKEEAADALAARDKAMAQIRSLLDTLKALGEEKKGLILSRDTAMAELEDLQAGMASMRARVRQLEREASGGGRKDDLSALLQSKVAGLERSKREAEERAERDREALEEARAQIARLSAELEAARAERVQTPVSSGNSELVEQLRDEVSSLRRQLSEAEAQAAAAVEAAAHRVADPTSAEGRSSSLLGLSGSQQGGGGVVDMRVPDSVRKLLQESESARRAAEKAAEEAEFRVAELQSEKDAQAAELSAAKQRLAGASTELEAARAAAARHGGMLVDSAHRTAVTATVRELHSTMVALRGEIRAGLARERALKAERDAAVAASAIGVPSVVRPSDGSSGPASGVKISSAERQAASLAERFSTNLGKLRECIDTEDLRGAEARLTQLAEVASLNKAALATLAERLRQHEAAEAALALNLRQQLDSELESEARWRRQARTADSHGEEAVDALRSAEEEISELREQISELSAENDALSTLIGRYEDARGETATSPSIADDREDSDREPRRLVAEALAKARQDNDVAIESLRTAVKQLRLAAAPHEDDGASDTTSSARTVESGVDIQTLASSVTDLANRIARAELHPAVVDRLVDADDFGFKPAIKRLESQLAAAVKSADDARSALEERTRAHTELSSKYEAKVEAAATTAARVGVLEAALRESNAKVDAKRAKVKALKQELAAERASRGERTHAPRGEPRERADSAARSPHVKSTTDRGAASGRLDTPSPSSHPHAKSSPSAKDSAVANEDKGGEEDAGEAGSGAGADETKGAPGSTDAPPTPQPSEPSRLPPASSPRRAAPERPLEGEGFTAESDGVQKHDDVEKPDESLSALLALAEAPTERYESPPRERPPPAIPTDSAGGSDSKAAKAALLRAKLNAGEPIASSVGEVPARRAPAPPSGGTASLPSSARLAASGQWSPALGTAFAPRHGTAGLLSGSLGTPTVVRHAPPPQFAAAAARAGAVTTPPTVPGSAPRRRAPPPRPPGN